MGKYSPMMEHYLSVKKEYNDCVIFYRLGDFYEMFFDDAVEISKVLELTLTGRECGQTERAPMCGIPYHSADNYIAKLVDKGYKVAICEQVEDPKTASGMVKREVVRVVTPGTVMEKNLLSENKNNYIMAIVKKGIHYGIATCDITTGDFNACKISDINGFNKVLDEIAKFSPAEIIVNEFLFKTQEAISTINQRFNLFISCREEDKFVPNFDNLLNYSLEDENKNEVKLCSSKDLNKDDTLIACAINGLLEYLADTQKMKLDYIHKINIYSINQNMILDISARRNLELVETMRDKAKKGTLLWVLDDTQTAMGARNLRRWVTNPLINKEDITQRLNAVEELKDKLVLRGDLRELLKKVYDIERLVVKISYGNCNARDMISLKNSILNLPAIKKELKNGSTELLSTFYKELDCLEDIYALIEKSIDDEPPITVKEGNLLKKGFNEEVDKLKEISSNGKSWLIKLEADEKQKTGIKNLKIGFNKVFGYYLEVSKGNLSLVPDYFIRKQTLTNGERYITEDLKNLENEILGADEKLIDLEYEIFTQIRNIIKEEVYRIQKTAQIIGEIDTLCSFAQVAENNNYTKPKITKTGKLNIQNGRHPVIEKMVSTSEFVPNNTYLDLEKDRLSIITGPNMAGKSTYMRQVALITLMGQVGSFVPAEMAEIGIVDKIFTRVGASDDLGMGQSTFMVEMMEVANILKEATKNSLIILDEIGRGTSTYDGLSIAWAVAEYLASKENCGAKTLFATHYHELTKLEGEVEGVKNYSIAVKENGEDIIFLRKIVEGGTDESYGVHVAKLAGVPYDVVKRANEILKTLERKDIIKDKGISKTNKQASGQLDMFNYKLADISHELEKIDTDTLRPIDALTTLIKLKEKLK